MPNNVRKTYRKWGLAKDEFADDGNWPHQLYICESKRMSGIFVTTENEVTNRKIVSNPVGIG